MKRAASSDIELKQLATRLRGHSLRMTSRARSSHVGSCLSVADIMAVLYGSVLRFRAQEPQWPDRDRVVISKGHAAAVVYAALAEAGLIPVEELAQYGENGGRLFGHVTHAAAPGIELSTGSLGHGLPVACGMALVAKRDGRAWRTFVVMSDGELDEGSNWEAMLFAGHHRLDKLTAIVDYNGIQSLDRVEKTLALEPLGEKARSFGWACVDVDGHDIGRLREALQSIPAEPTKPTFVIAHTIKGKGVRRMENSVVWHYRPPSSDELMEALAELEAEV